MAKSAKPAKNNIDSIGTINGLNRLDFDKFLRQDSDGFDWYKKLISDYYPKDEFVYCSDMFCSTSKANGTPVYSFTENSIVYSLDGIVLTEKGLTSVYSSNDEKLILFTLGNGAAYRTDRKILTAYSETKARIQATEKTISALTAALPVIKKFEGKVINARIDTELKNTTGERFCIRGSNSILSLSYVEGTAPAFVESIRMGKSFEAGEARFTHTRYNENTNIYPKSGVKYFTDNRLIPELLEVEILETIEREKKRLLELKKVTIKSLEKTAQNLKKLEVKFEELKTESYAVPSYIKEALNFNVRGI